MEEAYQDLLWLSRRLAGIIELKDEIWDYSKLKSIRNDLEATRRELQELQASKVKAEQELEETRGRLFMTNSTLSIAEDKLAKIKAEIESIKSKI